MYPAVGVAVLLLVCCLDTVRADLETGLCDPKESCGDDWYYFDGKERCGLYVMNPLTFSEAEKYCKEQGGELLSISSEKEDFEASCLSFDVFDISHQIWIGAENSEGEFKWTDGTPFSYTYWYKGEPKGTGCAEINFYHLASWSVVDCSKKNFALCTKKA
ncbi:C-type isolectin Sp-CL4-like [Antennarius striatus]|uniref:C-type isolectin Sp-CL4-like n=1 Tax=Antennarius striatus TaxID=241820 RepID=UPI0035B34D40